MKMPLIKGAVVAGICLGLSLAAVAGPKNFHNRNYDKPTVTPRTTSANQCESRTFSKNSICKKQARASQDIVSKPAKLGTATKY